MLSHYLYRITAPASGDFYVGVRSCECRPSDDPYMGSGVWAKSARQDGVRTVREVLATFDTRDDAEEAERLLIDMVIADKRCQNSWKSASADVRPSVRRGRSYRW